MKNIIKELKKIYTAKQCTDLEDVDIAIQELIELSHLYDYSIPALQKRYASLHKRYFELAKKETGNRKYIIDLDKMKITINIENTNKSAADIFHWLTEIFEKQDNFIGIRMQKLF